MNYISIVIYIICVICSDFATGCRILALSGGGAHAAYQAGVIKKLSDSGYEWDVITGVSAGSLNGIILALYPSDQQDSAVKIMENIWLSINSSSIYKHNWNPIYSQSFYDTQPLNNTITKVVEANGGMAKRDIIIGTVRMNDGIMSLYNQTSLNYTNRVVDIVMASSAIPVAFPSIFLDDHYYIDGGTFSNEIIRPGINSCFKKGDKNVTIDLVLCSAPIQNMTNQEIRKETIFGVIERAYSIISNSVTNHEMYITCTGKQNVFPMNIYKHDKPFPGGLLDFNPQYLELMFTMGYAFSTPIKVNYCY